MFRLLWVAAVALGISACSDGHSERVAIAGSIGQGERLPLLPVPEMITYQDPSIGYEAQVPVGWRRVVLDDQDQHSFSVVFESPPSGESDKFADYVMIEVVPGHSPAGFPDEPDERTSMVVDGETVFREHFVLDDFPVADTRIDLVAWQISIARPGYAVGIYAVGESREDSRLERILIELAHSFSLQRAPFQVS